MILRIFFNNKISQTECYFVIKKTFQEHVLQYKLAVGEPSGDWKDRKGVNAGLMRESGIQPRQNLAKRLFKQKQ